jgi:hypothetical protein
MNNNIKIFYNNVDLFNGISPTPFVYFDQEFIDYKTGWNQITTVTMNGQITGARLGTLSFYEINDAFNLLLNRLSNNYGNLVIQENSETLFSGNSVVVNSIESEENNWYGILPFNVNFTVYETGLFSNYFGIIEPEETITVSEDKGLIVNLEHRISAKGLNVNNLSPIDNAKNWVSSRSGNYNKIFPVIASTGGGSNFLLNSVSESIDRFNSTYSLNLSYIKSSSFENPSGGLLSYTLNFNSGIQDGFITANLEGSFANNNISGSNSLRSGFLNYDFYTLANTACLKTFNTVLNSSPISQSITEEYSDNKLNFNISYSNDFTSNVVNDYTVDLNTDSIKNITNVTLKADIFAKYGDFNTRWGLVKSFYESSFSPFALARAVYQQELSKQLNSTPVTESITFDEYNAKITYQATWSDKRIPFSNDILTMQSSIDLTAPVIVHVVNTSAYTRREHNIQNLRTANRAVLNISVSAVAKPNKTVESAKSAVDTELNRIKRNYSLNDPLLQNRSVKTNDSLKTVSINEVWSSQGPIIT